MTSSGTPGDPLAPGVQHLGRALEREEHDAGVDLADREQVELERGDDAEVAAAAAQRPEELGLVVAVDAAQLAVGGDELDRGDAVRRQAVLAAVPADAAAERVADDADVRRRAVQRRQAELGGARRRRRPSRARRGRGRAAARGVDLDALERVGLQQDGVLEVAERAGVVAGALRGDPQAVRRARTRTTAATSSASSGERDQRGALVEDEVVGLAGGVPAGLARGARPRRRGGREGVGGAAGDVEAA